MAAQMPASEVPGVFVRTIVALTITVAAMAGCSEATPEPTATLTPTPTHSPVPQVAESPTVTATVAASPTFSTPDATPTPTASPAPTGIPRAEIPLYGGEVTALLVAPQDPLLVYAGTKSAGVFRSDDGAVSWRPARDGLPAARVSQLLAHPIRPGVVYAALGSSGVWETVDGGGMWEPASSGLPPDLAVTCLAMAGDPPVLYAGMMGGGGEVGTVCTYGGAGEPWSCHAVHISEEDSVGLGVLSLLADVGSPTRLFVGTLSRGVLLSGDQGRTWMPQNNGLPLLSGSETRHDAVIALSSHAGVSRGTFAAVVGGEYYVWDMRWNRVSQDHPVLGEALFASPARPGTLYGAGGLNGYAYVSHDSGVHWDRMLGPPNWGRVSSIVSHPDSPDRLYVAALAWPKGLGGVLVSIDGGESWQLSRRGLTALSVTSLAVDPHDPHRLLVGTATGHILHSQDGGQTWGQVYLRASPVSDIVFDPLQSDRAYALAGDLFVSSDAGRSFAREPAIQFGQAMATDSVQRELYVGSASGRGIFSSRDGGTSWSLLDEGLPPYGAKTCPVLCLALDGSRRGIWAGMQYGCGLAFLPDGGSVWQQTGFPGSQAVTALWAGADGLLLVGVQEPSNRLYISGDSGRTWTLSWEGDSVARSILCESGSGNCFMGTAGSGLFALSSIVADWDVFDVGLFSSQVQAMALKRIAGSEGVDLLVGTDAGLDAISLDRAP